MHHCFHVNLPVFFAPGKDETDITDYVDIEEL